ncbi:MAG TPA: SURF1 family protein [Candidatus Eisenbacteria bacterium]
MRPAHLLAAALVIGMSALCVRLGFWQISRWHEKQRLNAEMRATLASPVLELGGEPGAYGAVRGHRVAARGRFDESRQILLSLRTHEGSPGVEVVTPLVLAGGRQAVLVDRGWLYASDGATARPQDDREPGGRIVTGVPVELARAPGGGASSSALRLLARDSLTLWSARTLDPDSLAARFPYALAPWMLRELPGPGVPARPLRSEPRPLDEMMHVSYAVQWFLFASILLGGSAALATSRRRRPRGGGEHRATSEADPDLFRRG